MNVRGEDNKQLRKSLVTNLIKVSTNKLIFQKPPIDDLPYLLDHIRRLSEFIGN